jgi:hypothetical protein
MPFIPVQCTGHSGNLRKKSGSLVFYGLNDYIAGEFAGFYGALQVYFGRLSQQWDSRI